MSIMIEVQEQWQSFMQSFQGYFHQRCGRDGYKIHIFSFESMDDTDITKDENERRVEGSSQLLNRSFARMWKCSAERAGD